MSANNSIGWVTKLTSESKALLEAMDEEVLSPSWKPDKVKPIMDGMTVASARATTVELNEELARLQLMKTRIIELKDKMKETAGL